MTQFENLCNTKIEPSPYSDFITRLKGRAGEGERSRPGSRRDGAGHRKRAIFFSSSSGRSTWAAGCSELHPPCETG